jgi:hypothetical protein
MDLPTRQLRELSLFSGMGAFTLALRLAGLDTRTVCYVEHDKYAQQVLQQRFGDGLDPAPIWDDINTFDPGPWRGHVDIVSAGFPCQPHSKPEPVGSPKDLTMIETFGPRHESAFGYWDASTSCLRTYQASFLEMMDGRAMGSVYLGTFPYWGLMQDGEFIAQPTPGHRTSGNGGGSWPTPNASDSYNANMKDGHDLTKGYLRGVVHWPTPRAGKTTDEEEESWRARYEDGKVNTPPLGLAVQMWPTPQAMDSITRSNESFHRIMDRPRQGTMLPKLADIIHVEPTHHILTPTTADVYTGNMKSTQQSDGSMHSVTLPDYVEMFPTPSTMDHIERKGMRPSRAATNRTTGYLSEEVEGSLNPDWVERYLMSLPEGWTRLEPVPDGAYDEWFDAMRDGTWWDTERGLPRVTTGAENRVNRLKMLGNGIVPASAALAIKDMSTW